MEVHTEIFFIAAHFNPAAIAVILMLHCIVKIRRVESGTRAHDG